MNIFRRIFWTLAVSTACCVCLAEVKDFTGQELDKKNFADENLNKARLDRAKLKYANFSNATMKHATLVGADLRNASFRGANLEHADFTGAKLDGAHFTDAKAWYANFSGCDIYLARAEPLEFSNVRLDPGAEEIIRAYDDAECGSLSFKFADLHDSLILGNAKGVDFRDADLRGADLGHVENLDQAILRGAKYDHETRWAIDPVKVGAVYTESEKPSPPRHPLSGKWLIIKGIDGAPDHGTLHIWRDNTFEWDTALSKEKPQIVAGVWTVVGDKIELKDGEGGHTWTAEKSEHKGQPEIILKSDKGEKRLGVGD